MAPGNVEEAEDAEEHNEEETETETETNENVREETSQEDIEEKQRERAKEEARKARVRREMRRLEGFYNEDARQTLQDLDKETPGDEVSNFNVDQLMTNFGFVMMDDDEPKTF